MAHSFCIGCYLCYRARGVPLRKEELKVLRLQMVRCCFAEEDEAKSSGDSAYLVWNVTKRKERYNFVALW
jgi:hypothetical protein